jgi:hypothetical protein
MRQAGLHVDALSEELGPQSLCVRSPLPDHSQRGKTSSSASPCSKVLLSPKPRLDVDHAVVWDTWLYSSPLLGRRAFAEDAPTFDYGRPCRHASLL